MLLQTSLTRANTSFAKTCSHSLTTPATPNNKSTMKTPPALRQTVALAAGSILAAGLIIRAAQPANYVAHEWGTFTSVQGGDGELLYWHPLQNTELPGFVYNWTKAGLNRGGLVGPKIGLVTLQRMETPVIYFYADK